MASILYTALRVDRLRRNWEENRTVRSTLFCNDACLLLSASINTISFHPSVLQHEHLMQLAKFGTQLCKTLKFPSSWCPFPRYFQKITLQGHLTPHALVRQWWQTCIAFSRQRNTPNCMRRPPNGYLNISDRIWPQMSEVKIRFSRPLVNLFKTTPCNVFKDLIQPIPEQKICWEYGLNWILR